MNVSFKSANVNINVISDTHGHINDCDKFLGTFKDNQKNLTTNGGRGNADLFAVCGDWFISGGSKGYHSDPQKPFGLFQLDVFNKMTDSLKSSVEGLQTIFIPGNHEYDGGSQLLSDTFEKLNNDTTILNTNLDLKKSSVFKKSIDEGKLVNSKVIEVEDDKEDGVFHKVLLLGVSPVNLEYYCKNIAGTKFIDNINIPQKQVEPEHYENTMQDCINRINDFKSENPDGAVVFFSHTGVNFAENLIRRTKHVDFVFDGHEHKVGINYVDDVPVFALSKDFNYFGNLKLHFDDNGKLTLNYSQIPVKKSKSLPDKEMTDFYNNLIKDDLKPEYMIISNINGDLSDKDIRLGENALANFITDSILSEIKKIDDSVDIFALNASAMRNYLPSGKDHPINHMQVMNLLSGITEQEAEIVTTKVSGEQLMEILLDNYLLNRTAPERIPIIHYSGLTVDRTAFLKAHDSGSKYSELAECVKTADGKTIDLNKTYNIANVIKYFNKMQNHDLKELGKKSKSLNVSVKQLFEKYFEENQTINFHYEPRIF